MARRGRVCVVFVVRQGKGRRGAKGMRPCACRASGVGKGGRGGTRAWQGPELETMWHSRAVELCTALGWDLDLSRLSSYVSRARPVRSGPYYQFPESREPGSHGRPAGLTVFRF